MKYFIYCRKSSEEDTRQIQSLDTQLRLLSDLAANNKLEVVEVFKESKSARVANNRPLFNLMIKRIQKGDADGLLVVHTDRLARNFMDAGLVINLLETGKLKEVRTPTNLYNTTQSLLYMGFDFVFAAHYSRDLSVKVKAGMESKLLKGEYPGHAPIGYINVPPGKGIIPDPQRAQYITEAFDLFASGAYSLKALAKTLYKNGFRTKLGKRAYTSVIHRILTNPDYCGVIVRKGKTYTGKHKPLTTNAIFETVQERLADKSRPRKQIHNLIYREFMNCAVCGCKITAGIAKHKYIYYRCTNGKGYCEQHKNYWSVDKVESSFQDFFSEITLSSDLAQSSFNLYRDSVLEGKKSEENHLAVLQQQLDSVRKRLGRLEDMWLEERISSDHYDTKRKELLKEQSDVENSLKGCGNADPHSTLELLDEIKNQAISLDKIFSEGDDQVKQDLLRSVLWNCTFQDGKIVSARLNKLWQPLENLNKTSEIEIWRKWWDSNPRDPCGSRFSKPLPLATRRHFQAAAVGYSSAIVP